MIEQRVTLINRLGLHARAAGKLVQTAARFQAQVWVERDGRQANAKSIMGVLMLAAPCGETLLLRAEGDDEVQAISALQALIDSRFGEEN